MKKIVVLDGITLGNVDFDKLKEFGELVYFDKTNPDEVADRVKDAAIVLTNKVVLNRENLKDASKLELICIF